MKCPLSTPYLRRIGMAAGICHVIFTHDAGMSRYHSTESIALINTNIGRSAMPDSTPEGPHDGTIELNDLTPEEQKAIQAGSDVGGRVPRTQCQQPTLDGLTQTKDISPRDHAALDGRCCC